MTATADTSGSNVAVAARVWNFLLGGKDNYESDRIVARELLALMPDADTTALSGRAFLAKAIEYIVAAGVEQVVDLGFGLPMPPRLENTHDVARRINRSVRVIYLDTDPVVLAHGRALLHHPGGAIVDADIRDPKHVLDLLRGEQVDFTRPVGLVLTSVLHHLSDDEDPAAIVDVLRTALPAGSFLVMSHLCVETMQSYRAAAATALFSKLGAFHPRSLNQISNLFDGAELVGPGVVEASAHWRPGERSQADHPPKRGWQLIGGVARVPDHD
ncbi:SAM-dependent methyltransferase [Sphaerisporangium sp. NPDC049003]|uniref:SAM-dependent methyltransferase n=1 Tax=Sphaerisporangium sp. NPDC049003 TaxID=3364517 RepID=UPI00371EB6E4